MYIWVYSNRFKASALSSKGWNIKITTIKTGSAVCLFGGLGACGRPRTEFFFSYFFFIVELFNNLYIFFFETSIYFCYPEMRNSVVCTTSSSMFLISIHPHSFHYFVKAALRRSDTPAKTTCFKMKNFFFLHTKILIQLSAHCCCPFLSCISAVWKRASTKEAKRWQIFAKQCLLVEEFSACGNSSRSATKSSSTRT